MESAARYRERYSSVSETAGRFGLSASYLRKEIRRGRLRATRFGRAIRLAERDVQAFVARAGQRG
jgi:excisionase family DNA binding protein